MLTTAHRTSDIRLDAVSSPRERVRWLSVVTHLDPRFGGLSAAVPQLSSEIAERECMHMDLAAFCSPGELFSTSSFPQLAISEWPASRAKWFRKRTLREDFHTLVDHADGVHIHGIWEVSTWVAAQAARSRGVPYVVSAHGMLERWALGQKALKKAVYGALIERPTLKRAACLHALTQAEAEDYRRFGCTAPIAVIPNGVRVPSVVTSDLFLRQHRELEGKRIVLFLGRIHAKKGLDLLVRAWREVADEHPEAHLVLAGPDFEGTRARIAALIEAEGLGDQILLPGMLRGEQKWSALAAAECFVLPSFSEGLSISVLEAMGVGVPVIISTQCNLPEVAEVGAGWVIPAEGKALASALLSMLGQSPASNQETGGRGRVFVRERYNWGTVAGKMGEVYRWVTDGGNAPASVQLAGGKER